MKKKLQGKITFSYLNLAVECCNSVDLISQGSCFNTSELGMQQLIKAGREGVYYKAKITRGTCKGHSIVTCKMTKEGNDKSTKLTTKLS